MLQNGEEVTGVVVDEGTTGYLIRTADGTMVRVSYQDVLSVSVATSEEHSSEGGEIPAPPSSSINPLEADNSSSEPNASQDLNLLEQGVTGSSSINLLTPNQEASTGPVNLLGMPDTEAVSEEMAESDESSPTVEPEQADGQPVAPRSVHHRN